MQSLREPVFPGGLSPRLICAPAFSHWVMDAMATGTARRCRGAWLALRLPSATCEVPFRLTVLGSSPGVPEESGRGLGDAPCSGLALSAPSCLLPGIIPSKPPAPKP